jgi:hypothetical protein
LCTELKYRTYIHREFKFSKWDQHKGVWQVEKHLPIGVDGPALEWSTAACLWDMFVDVAFEVMSVFLALQDFTEHLASSRNYKEKMLHEVLHLQILPKLVETANARRRAEEKAALLAAMPKKRSNRLQVGGYTYI